MPAIYPPRVFTGLELAFSKIKSWQHQNHDQLNAVIESNDGTVYAAFWEAIHSATVENTRGWWKHCGYNMPI